MAALAPVLKRAAALVGAVLFGLLRVFHAYQDFVTAQQLIEQITKSPPGSFDQLVRLLQAASDPLLTVLAIGLGLYAVFPRRWLPKRAVIELRAATAALDPGQGYDARLAIRNLGPTATFVVRGQIKSAFNDPNIVPSDSYLMPWADTNGGTEEIEIPHGEERSVRVAMTLVDYSTRLTYLRLWEGDPSAYVGTVKPHHEVRWDITDSPKLPYYEVRVEVSRNRSGVTPKTIWVTAKEKMGPAEVRMSKPDGQ